MEKQAVRIGDIARVTQGNSSGDLDAVVTDVSHDSRQAKSGSLFVAVRGELFDAHKFIPQVMEQGAVGILSELEPTIEWRSPPPKSITILRANLISPASPEQMERQPARI